MASDTKKQAKPGKPCESEETASQQQQDQFSLPVYNTFTGKKETVEVSKALYQLCRRTEWAIKNNDRSFFAHEIQFSSMCESDNVDVMNFREFISEESSMENVYERANRKRLGYLALHSLTPQQQRRFRLHFEDKLTYKEIAELEEVTEAAVKASIVAARKRIGIFLKNNEK